MKWAQHIAEGRPLDFSQKQISDFRYSLILDIANGGPICNMSTQPDHHSVECYCLSKDSVIDTNSSCTSLKGKAQKTHYHLRRMRAYNLIELFKFITEDLEMYFPRKLLSLAFGKPQNLHLASRCFGRSASSVSQSTITIDEKNPSKFHVPSREDNNIIYTVDCTIGTCTCPQGTSGNACPHQAAVALKFGISNINFVPQTAKERFNLAILAVGNNNNFSVTQFVSLHQKEIESSPHFYKDQDKDHDEQQVILPSMPACWLTRKY